MNDIGTRADIIVLVDSFYEKATADPLLGPVFNDIARVDWTRHKPVMYDFWETILLGNPAYRGNAFQPHAKLPIDGRYFSRWLELFRQTLAENFSGEISALAASKAGLLATIFQNKMGIIPVEQ